MTEAAADWEERQRRFKRFDDGVFNIMKLALLGDLTPEALSQVEKDVRLSIDKEARAEMMRYTDEIEISAYGKEHRGGWWWNRKTTKKYISVDVIFDPYRSHLAAWTDPTVPGGIVLFQ